MGIHDTGWLATGQALDAALRALNAIYSRYGSGGIITPTTMHTNTIPSEPPPTAIPPISITQHPVSVG